MFHGIKFLQIKQLAFQQAKEILNDSIIQAVTFPAHALADALITKHSLILLVLVLPALIGVKDQIGSIRQVLKSLVQHGGYHRENGSV